MNDEPEHTLRRWLTSPHFTGLLFDGSGAPRIPRLGSPSSSHRPQQRGDGAATSGTCITRLAPLGPRFVSVTYGAGGSTRERTHGTVARLARETTLVPAAHLTCVGATREEVNDVARQYWEAGVRHIVALRGDPPPGTEYAPHPGGYPFAADLVAGLHAVAPFEISVGAYPETHPAAVSPGADLDGFAVRKLDERTPRERSRSIFFDTDVYLRFLDRCLAAGITAPVVPGIMPVSNFTQIARFSALCGASVPGWLGPAVLEVTEEEPELRRMIGMVVAAEQVRLLQANGVDEFHFYTLNRPELTYAIAHLLGCRAEASDSGDETDIGASLHRSSTTPPQSPGRGWRNIRIVGYQGEVTS